MWVQGSCPSSNLAHQADHWQGHHKDKNSPLTSQKTITAGSPFSFTIGGNIIPGGLGGAPHNGGSCQAVISHDMGATWSVIASHIGGCIVDSRTETITMPKDTWSGDALFGWNWFNHEGNREMYQNCAVITIKNGGPGLTDKKKYPSPFVANIGLNQCQTKNSTDVVFPEPGNQVIFGGKFKGTTPAPGGFTGTNCELSGGHTVATASASPAAPSTSAAGKAGNYQRSNTDPNSIVQVEKRHQRLLRSRRSLEQPSAIPTEHKE